MGLFLREDDAARRKETARKWSALYRADIRPEQINCLGCKSDGARFFHCGVCDIRQCCFSKGVDNCALCEDYICDKLSSFIKLAPEAGAALEAIRNA
ncbi:MAG: DUF3795 domain-containing protein [Deltaproteobacteria bacterium]